MSSPVSEPGNSPQPSSHRAEFNQSAPNTLSVPGHSANHNAASTVAPTIRINSEEASLDKLGGSRVSSPTAHSREVVGILPNVISDTLLKSELAIMSG